MSQCGFGALEVAWSTLRLIYSCLTQEFHYMEEDLHRTKNTLQSRIKDREEEIQKLRNQVGMRKVGVLSHFSEVFSLHFLQNLM